MIDALIAKFVDNLRLQNENTAETVAYFLKDFDMFSADHLKSTKTTDIKIGCIGTGCNRIAHIWA